MKRLLPTLTSLLILPAILMAMVIMASGGKTRSVARTAPATGTVVSRTVAHPAPPAAVAHPRAARVAKRAAARHAAVPAPSAPAAVAAPPAVPPGTAGLRVYLDPETGTLGGPGPMVTPDEDVSPLNESDEGLVQQVMPDGHVMMDLQGRFADYVLVTIDASGRLVFQYARDPRLPRELAPLPVAKPVER